MLYCKHENDLLQHGARRIPSRARRAPPKAAGRRRAHRHRPRQVHRLLRARRHRHSRAGRGVQCPRDLFHEARGKEHGREDQKMSHSAGLRHAARKRHRGEPRQSGLLSQGGEVCGFCGGVLCRADRSAQQRHHPREAARCGKARPRKRPRQVRGYGAHLRKVRDGARRPAQRFHHPSRGLRRVAQGGRGGARALLCGGSLRFQGSGAGHPRGAGEVRALPHRGDGEREGEPQREDLSRRRGGEAHRSLRGRGSRLRERGTAPRARRGLTQTFLL